MGKYTTIFAFLIILAEITLFFYLWPKIYRYVRYGRARPQPLVVPFYPDQNNGLENIIDRPRDRARMRSAAIAVDEDGGEGGRGLERIEMGSLEIVRNGQVMGSITNYGTTNDASGRGTMPGGDLGDVRNRNGSP